MKNNYFHINFKYLLDKNNYGLTELANIINQKYSNRLDKPVNYQNFQSYLKPEENSEPRSPLLAIFTDLFGISAYDLFYKNLCKENDNSEPKSQYSIACIADEICQKICKICMKLLPDDKDTIWILSRDMFKKHKLKSPKVVENKGEKRKTKTDFNTRGEIKRGKVKN